MIFPQWGEVIYSSIYMIRATEDDFSAVRRSDIFVDLYNKGELRSLLLNEEKWYVCWYAGIMLLYIFLTSVRRSLMNVIYRFRATEDAISSVRRSDVLVNLYDSGDCRWLFLSEEKWYIRRFIWFERLKMIFPQWGEVIYFSVNLIKANWDHFSSVRKSVMYVDI